MAIQTLLFDEEAQHNNKPPTKTGEGDAHTDRSDSMADAYYQCQTNRYCQERSDSVNFPQSQSCCHFSRYFMKMKNGPQYFSMLFVFLFVPPFSPPISVCGSDSSSGGAFTHLMHLVSHLTCCQSTHQPQYKSPGLSCSDRQIVHSATLVEILATHNSQ